MSFAPLFSFEQALSEYTGAPYVVATDSCTHAIELCLRMDCVTSCEFTAFTYLSIPQLMRQLGIHYALKTEYWNHDAEYRFHGTNIWDSARLLKHGMYRPGMKQCLSFGHGKPLALGRVGAILLDNQAEYECLSRMRSDGRDLRIIPWINQRTFGEGYHYCPSLESCEQGTKLLPQVTVNHTHQDYPDLRTVDFSVWV